jgi:hypothetical protein
MLQPSRITVCSHLQMPQSKQHKRLRIKTQKRDQNMETDTDQIATLRRQLALAEEQKALLEKAAAAKYARLAIEAKESAELREAEKHRERQRRLEDAQRQMIAAAEASELRKRQEKAEHARLEREAEKLAEAIRERETQREKERLFEERIRNLEADNQQRLAELQRATQPLAEADKPVTLSDARNPLSQIRFGVVPDMPIKEVSASQQAVTQGEADRVADVERMRSARKSPPFADLGTSRELSDLLLKELKINPNPMKLDELSAKFTYEALMQSARNVISQAKAKPMSSDGILYMIESACEALDTPVVSSQPELFGTTTIALGPYPPVAAGGAQ